MSADVLLQTHPRRHDNQNRHIFGLKATCLSWKASHHSRRQIDVGAAEPPAEQSMSTTSSTETPNLSVQPPSLFVSQNSSAVFCSPNGAALRLHLHPTVIKGEMMRICKQEWSCPVMCVWLLLTGDVSEAVWCRLSQRARFWIPACFQVIYGRGEARREAWG